MQEVDYVEHLELKLENIKLKHALRSFVDAHERSLAGQLPVTFTQQEIERIKLVQSLL